MAEMAPCSKWMDSWLMTSFYSDHCETHNKMKKCMTVYCGVCMGKPFCRFCWDSHLSSCHHDHTPILHVRSASNRAAIRLVDIKKIWDVSGVQVYNINSAEILHLNPKPNINTLKQSRSRDDQITPKCESCNYKLLDARFCFCSIACKHYSTNGGMQREEVVERAMERNEVISATNPSLRKPNRRRKGNPQRAPFF